MQFNITFLIFYLNIFVLNTVTFFSKHFASYKTNPATLKNFVTHFALINLFWQEYVTIYFWSFSNDKNDIFLDKHLINVPLNQSWLS